MNKGVKKKHICATVLGIIFSLLPFAPIMIYAQNSPFEEDQEDIHSPFEGGQGDVKEGTLGDVHSPFEGGQGDVKVAPPPFKPNPKTAWRTALLFPGFGQIYNRQYWKLPIVYGGLMGCTYAITWNNKTYQDYKGAYFSIMADAKADPEAAYPENWSESWKVFVPGGVDPATRLHNSTFHQNLKRGKDYFRRYRDLSIIITLAVYLISVADAYVDAQMFDFDVSPDLSFQFSPVFTPETLYHSKSYGISICMNF